MLARCSTACQLLLAIAMLTVRATAGEIEPAEFPIELPELSSWPESAPHPPLPPFAVDSGDCYIWQVLPPGLMYHSYLAGEKEPRFQWVFLSEKDRGMVWEAALGGRIGILRHGTCGAINPQGWQLDLEGAALPRVDPEQHDDLEAVDFRVGLVSTSRHGPNAFKAGYYHLSSHVGDEFLIANPGFARQNYVRDSLIAGWTHDVTTSTQIYGEIGYAFNHEDGAEPLELQFGTQYLPWGDGCRGAPFAAFNVHLREDFDFETSINVVAGWQWRGPQTDHRFRAGVQYYDGPSMQWSFTNLHETLIGGGLWCDY